MNKLCTTCRHYLVNSSVACPYLDVCTGYSHWTPMQVEAPENVVVNPFSYQVGGEHYRNNEVMGPAEWCLRNKLGHAESCAIKYIFRHKDKGGLESLRKAVHYLEFLAFLEYGENL